MLASSNFLSQLLRREAMRDPMALLPVLERARRYAQLRSRGGLRKLVPLSPGAQQIAECGGSCASLPARSLARWHRSPGVERAPTRPRYPFRARQQLRYVWHSDTMLYVIDVCKFPRLPTNSLRVLRTRRRGGDALRATPQSHYPVGIVTSAYTPLTYSRAFN